MKRFFLVFIILMALTGCGGSGGGSDDSNSTPSANAGLDQNVVTGTLVTLNGSGSSDADGNLLTYSWIFTTKPATSGATLTGATTVKPTFTADVDGTYILSLVVNDGANDSAEDFVSITAATPNSAPVANAGPDQNVVTGSLVTLNGSLSSDANLDPLTFSWTLTTKPAGSGATLTGATNAKPTFTADKDGTYILSLIVNDGVVNSAADSVSITAATPNSAPVANAGPDQNVATGSLVTLDGSASSDADLDTLTYLWAFTSKPAGSTVTNVSNPAAVKPTFTPDVDGDYVLNLTVNDGTVSSAPAVVTITAATPNSAPVANAGPDQNVATGSLVTLDGSASSDADLDPLTYSWTMSPPAGSALTTANLSDPVAAKPTFTPDVDGDYVFTLIVNDGTVSSAPAVVTITAATPNSAPVANAGPDQNVATGSLVTLDGSASSDADLDPLTYSWTMSPPAGSALTTANLSDPVAAQPTFTPDVDGDYVFTLIVNDGTVDSAPAVVTITAATPNSAPVANAGPDQNVATGSLVTLDGSASSDADLDPLTYSWTMSPPAGSALTTADLSDPVAAQPTFTPDVDGDYVFTLIVNDGTVDSAPAVVTITAATLNSAPVANAGPDQNVATGSLVTLDGSASSDADLDPLTYSWTMSPPAGSALTTANLSDPATAQPTFTPDVDGDYVFTLIVNDGTVDSAPAVVTITAATLNSAPVANAGPDQNAVTGSLVTLDGSASSDADLDPLTYSWTMSPPAGSALTTADLSDPATAQPTFTPDVDGDYVFTLIVNDGTVDSAPAVVTITAGTYNSTTPILDDFNRADEGPPPSASWLNVTGAGAFAVVSNQAQPTSSEPHLNYWNTSFGLDQEVYFTIATKPTVDNNSSLGAFLRYDATNGYGYLVTLVPQADTDSIRMWRLAGTTATLLVTTPQEFGVGDKVMFTAVDNIISVYLDQGSGYKLISTVSDSTYNSSGYIGIYAVTTTGALDDFGGGTIVP